MISVEEALARCLALAAPLPPETVPLAQAAGRWMCAPATARRNCASIRSPSCWLGLDPPGMGGAP